MATRKQRDDEEREKKEKKPEAREERQEAAGTDDEVVEIEVSEEEEGEEETEAEEEQPRLTRAQKKNQRGFTEFKQRADSAEAELARLRAEREAERAQQHIQAQQYQYQQQAQGELDRVYEDQKTLYAAYEAQRAQGLTDAQAADFERRAREIELRKYAIISHQNGAGQQVDPRQIQAMVEYNAIRAKYADIYANESAVRWGDARLRQLAAEHGGQLTPDVVYQLLDQAAEDTRQRFGLGNRQRRPAPDAATRARFSAVPSRNGVASGPTTSVRMGRAQKQLARARYPELSEQEAYKKWANGPGRRAALASQKDR